MVPSPICHFIDGDEKCAHGLKLLAGHCDPQALLRSDQMVDVLG
jgi:hypothetical protein